MVLGHRWSPGWCRAAAAVAAVRLAPAWPEMGSRYDAPATHGPSAAATPAEERTSLDLWKSMDEGDDPTDHERTTDPLESVAHTEPRSACMSDNHGNTPAAWTAVFVALVGFVVGGVGLMLSPISMVLFWIGVVIVVAAAPGLRGDGPGRPAPEQSLTGEHVVTTAPSSPDPG